MVEVDIACVSTGRPSMVFSDELSNSGFKTNFLPISQLEKTPVDTHPKALFLAATDIRQAAKTLNEKNLVFDLLVSRTSKVLDCPDILARCGAILIYPWDQQTLTEAIVETILSTDESDVLPGTLKLNLIGESEPVKNLIRVVDRVAGYDAPVLVTGETGTGKELIARGIHYESKRCDFPFVPVNCGALTDELLISELFGYEPGAFTDAKRQHVGLVAQASQGTLFLDEVDSLSLKAQASLLRFMQDQEYRPLGSEKVLRSDVRIICATNRDLLKLVLEGQFREDLFYRLKILDVHAPALKHRRQDIPLLIDYFLGEVGRKYDEPVKVLHPLTERWMVNNYDWPGNVRELENYVHRIFILSKTKTIYVPDILGLPLHVKNACKTATNGNHIQIGRFQEEKASHISRFERDYLATLMKYASGNVSEAARIAGKERRALGKLLKKHGIDYQSYRKPAN